MSTEYSRNEFPREKVLGIQTLSFVADLDPLNPPPTDEDERRALLAIYFQTGGSREGMAIADAWLRNGVTYQGLEITMSYWSLFDSMKDKPIGEAELVARFRKYQDKD